MCLLDPIGYLFCCRLSDRINVGCRLLNQRFDLRSLLGRERESRLQADEETFLVDADRRVHL